MILLSCIDGEEVHGARTLCLARRSFERAEDMILRRMDEGAEKCALRDLRLDDETSARSKGRTYESSAKVSQLPHRVPA